MGRFKIKFTDALQEILEQPITIHAKAGFSENSASVEFWVERNGKPEYLINGQGGSVANIVSVCQRIFALITLDEATHRRFLILDEQDCWLRADLVPKLVKIIHDASRALGFQVLMISHPKRHLFEQYADKIIELQWQNGKDTGGLHRRLGSIAPSGAEKHGMDRSIHRLLEICGLDAGRPGGPTELRRRCKPPLS